MTDDLESAAAELRAALSAVYRAVRATRAVAGLTPPEASALSRLHRHGPMTAAQLARGEQITPQSIGATLRTLTDAGLIERAPDPDDGRRLILTVTGAGRDVVERRRAHRDEQLTRALAGLPHDERDALMRALPALTHLAELTDP